MARGQQAIEDRKSDPVYLFHGEMRNTVKKDPFFFRTRYSDHVEGKFVFFIQHKDGVPFYERKLIGDYLPQLEKLEKSFQKGYAGRLKLSRHEDRPGYAVAILSSKGAYINFQEGHQFENHSMRAHYDPETRLAITYEQMYADGRQTEDERQAILHEFVHALQHAYYSGPGLMPKPVWFNEGLAEYLASSQSNKGAAVATEQAMVFLTLLKRGAGPTVANGLRDLVTIDGPGYLQVVEAALRRAPGNASREFAETAIGAFYAQSTLMTQFLHDGKAGKYRSGYMRYVKAVMSGERGWQPFVDAFGRGFDEALMEEEFMTFVRKRGRQLRPRIELSRDVQLPSSLRIDAVAEPAVARVDRSFAPDQLALEPGEWRPQLGLAVHEVQQGRLDEALARLAAVVPDSDEGKARIDGERARIGGVIEARNALLAKNRFVALDHEGKTLRGRVSRVENGIIYVKKGKKTLEVPLASVTTANLERELGKKGNKSLGTPSWVRAYLLVIGGAKKRAIDKQLKSAGKPGAALQHDRAGYAELQPLGAAAAMLHGLAAAPVPAERGGAAAAFDSVRKLLKLHRDTDIVQSRADALRSYARILLDKSFDPTDPKCLGLNGALRLRGDKVSLSYDFSDASQLKDFISDNGYASLLRRGGQGATQLRLQGTKLRLGGSACYRLKLPFSAPFTVTYSVGIAPLIEGNSMSWNGILFTGVCGDAAGSFVAASSGGSLSVLDKEMGIASDHSANSEVGVEFERTYNYELIHDGQSITLKLDGETLSSTTEIGNRKSGSLFLSVETPKGGMLVTEMSIEGVLDEAALKPVKNRWIAAKMEGL